MGEMLKGNNLVETLDAITQSRFRSTSYMLFCQQRSRVLNFLVFQQSPILNILYGPHHFVLRLAERSTKCFGSYKPPKFQSSAPRDSLVGIRK